MNACNNMVIYDHWSYMTMFSILEKVFIALGEGVQIDRLLFGEGPKTGNFLKNYLLTV